MAKLRAVLLDLDGTLVDSNDAHASAWVEALAEFGRHIHFERVRRLIGKGSDRLLPEVTGIDADSPEGRKIVSRRSELFLRSHAPRLVPFPCAASLTERLHQSGLQLVVATSANEKEMTALLGILGIERFIDAATNASAASSSKPAPDIVEAALAEVNCPPHEAILLGDTPYDIAAAQRASVRSIGLCCGGWSKSDLNGAVAVYDDPCDLLRSYETSPFVAAV